MSSIASEAMIAANDTAFAELRLWVDAAAAGQFAEVVDTSLPFKDAKERWNDHFERRYLAAVFGAHGGNITRAADHAGINRRHFRELLYKHGLLERPGDGGDGGDDDGDGRGGAARA